MIIKKEKQTLVCCTFSKALYVWCRELIGIRISVLTLFTLCAASRWAAEWTSSANRDTYCRDPPPASACWISPGPGSSPHVSVSLSEHSLSRFLHRSPVSLCSCSPSCHLVIMYPHYRLLRPPSSSVFASFQYLCHSLITFATRVNCS